MFLKREIPKSPWVSILNWSNDLDGVGVAPSWETSISFETTTTKVSSMEPEAAPTMTQPNSMMDAADGRSAAVSENNAYPNFAPCCIKFWQYTHPLWAWSWVKVDHSPPPAQEWGHGNSSAAKLLGLSPETSKGHLKNPYKYGDSPNKS